VRSASVLALLLALAACRSLPSPEPRLLPADEAEWVRTIQGGISAGSPDVPELVAGFLERHPHSVDARRYAQILRIARGEAWQVHEEARAAREADPDDPALLYLYARTIPDREIQRKLFLRVIDMDPSFFHANLGLAVVALSRHDGERAAAWAFRSFLIRFDSPRANVLYAGALAAGGHRGEAFAVLRSVIQMNPSDASAVMALLDLLLSGGQEVKALETIAAALAANVSSPRLLRRARELVRGGAARDRDLRALARVLEGREGAGVAELRLLAAIRIADGDAPAALALLDRAVHAGAGPLALRNERVRAALLAGEYGRAGRYWEEGLEALTIVPGASRREGALRSLRRAFETADPGGPDTLADLARALLLNGFSREAAEVALWAVALAPNRSELQELSREFAAWDRFLGDVRDAVRRSYWREKKEEGGSDLDAVLAALGRASKQHLGRDVVKGIPVEEWPFVGSLARTDFPGAPPSWSEHGILFVIGRRTDGPVQGTMMRIVGRWDDLLVEGVGYELIVGDGRLFPTYFEFDGGNIAGFAMPGRVVLDLDSLNQAEEALVRSADASVDRPLWPASGTARRRSLWFPNGVRARLAAGYVARSGDGTGSFETALRHEEGHVIDGAKYTPFTSHIPELIYQLFRHGFRTSSIEATLEENAEGHALLGSVHPGAVLFGTTSFLPYRHVAPPHSVAYYDLMERIIAEIDEHPDRYPSIDRGYNILQQLDRLTDAEMRRALDEGVR